MSESQPIAILAFDHRGEFSRSIFDRDLDALSEEETRKVTEAKTLAYEGFLAARKELPEGVRAGILADEEFAGEVLERSSDRDYLLAIPVERADQSVFQFDYGDDFLAHITKFAPDYVKALVRLNVHDEAGATEVQLSRLKYLSDTLRAEGIKFMFELVVRPSAAELASVGNVRERYEDELRPGSVLAAMHLIAAAGIWVDVWKLEGIANQSDAEAIARQARSTNPEAECILLGAAALSERLDTWLQVGAGTPGFSGFALGRSVWKDPIRAWLAGEASREVTIERITAAYVAFTREYLRRGVPA